MQHKSAVHCGIGSAVICHRLIDNDLRPPPVSDNQCRGAGCQKNSLAARSGEVFSLDIPFHRTFRLRAGKESAMKTALFPFVILIHAFSMLLGMAVSVR
jgi:hypothetical protein